jgi:hypothetical protein
LVEDSITKIYVKKYILSIIEISILFFLAGVCGLGINGSFCTLLFPLGAISVVISILIKHKYYKTEDLKKKKFLHKLNLLFTIIILVLAMLIAFIPILF